jgi:hypothetical protein
MDTTALYNFYIFLEVLLLGLFGIHQLKGQRFRVIATLGLAIAVISQVYEYIFQPSTFHATSFLINCIYLVSLYLGDILFLQSRDSLSLFRQPLLYLSVGIVIYFGCDIPFFSFRSVLMKYDTKLTTALHIFINNFLASFRYLLSGFAFVLFYINKRTASQLRHHDAQ